VNDALKEAQAVDPAWAKKEGRRRAILGLLTAGVLVALAVGVPALVIGFHNGTEITKVEHSACQVEPAGTECQQTKAESSKAANLRVTCIPFFKAGYPCPKPGSTTAERVARRQSLRAHPVQGSPTTPNEASVGSASPGGDATSAPTGHSEPAPGNGGPGEHGSSGSHHAAAPGDGGSHEAPAPVKSGSGGAPEPGAAGPAASPAPTSSQSTSTSTTERVESTVVEAPAPEAPAPVRSAVGGVVEGVTGTVEETTGTVNEVVGGVTCQLLHTC
jgi:hypothetical protein